MLDVSCSLVQYGDLRDWASTANLQEANNPHCCVHGHVLSKTMNVPQLSKKHQVKGEGTRINSKVEHEAEM